MPSRTSGPGRGAGSELGEGAAPDRAGEQGPESGLLAAVGLDDGVAAGCPHERGAGSGGATGVCRDPRRQGHGLVEHGAGVAHLEGQAELHQFGRR